MTSMVQQPPQIELPIDQKRSGIHSFMPGNHSVSITGSVWEALSQYSRRAGVSQSTVLLAAYFLFIHRYSSQNRLAVGLVEEGRLQSVPFDCTGDVSFGQMLRQLVEKKKGDEGLQENPSTQVLFYGGNDSDRLDMSQWTGYDLFLVCSFAEQKTDATFFYNAQRFDHSTIQRMLTNFSVLLEAIVSNPDQAVKDLPFLSKEERRTLLVEWNQTDRSYPADSCLHHLFEKTALHHPDRIAVEFGEEHMTYRRLDERSNQWAHYLRKQGVESGVKVAVCMERSPDMVVALLGILKAGGTYVPLDPIFPEHRLAYMLEDSCSEVVVTDQSSMPLWAQSDVQIIHLNDIGRKLASESCQATPELQASSEQTAYVIYTSGSTGKPKGVQVSHRSLINFLTSMSKEPGIRKEDRLLSVTTLSFDICALELFLPWMAGATTVLVSRDVAMDGKRLAEAIQKSSATVMQATPATWRLLLAAGWKGSPQLKILCGGEAWTRELAQELQARSAELWNMYGPTETTVWSTVHHVTEDVRMGRPIGNTQLYVLDKAMQPVPIGVPGELYIGGEGVAQGYLNRPDLTAERFLPNPFSGKGRMYRTGDLVRYLSDGTVEYLGRIDHQVKVRGYRIELPEIETVLQRHPAVHQAVVIAHGDETGEKRLIAYLEGKALPADRMIRDYCLTQLPEYMVPSAYIEMESLPLTPNGKVDRRALPAPSSSHINRNVAVSPPRTTEEEKLVAIFSELLGVQPIGVDESFFDLGGHSLLVSQLISRIDDLFQVRLSMHQVFEKKSAEKLAERIEDERCEKKEREALSLHPIPRNRALRMSFAQQRMWFLHCLDPENPAYNIPTVLHLKGSLHVDVLMRSVQEIIQRHESFRTRVCEKDGKPIQVIQESIDVEIPLVHLDQADCGQVYTLAKELANKPFDLTDVPLFRGALVQTDEQEHYLIWVVHHMVSDGWSEELFKRELVTLYDAFLNGEPSPLAELPIQYADYADWQHEWMNGNVAKQQLQYWKQQLAGSLPVLQLPTDKPRTAVQTFRGAIHRFTIQGRFYEKIKQLSHEADQTLFMTLLAAFNTLLHRYSGETDILVGFPVANRNHSETEGIMGFFVNTLVLRTDLSGNPTFQDLLHQVKEVALQAYDNQDIPFEKLVEELQPERNLSYSPLFQVMFVMENTSVKAMEMSGLSIQPTEFDPGTSKFDLTLFVKETEDGLLASFEYNTDLFEAATIERIANHFCHLLHHVATHPQQRVSELPLLTEEERKWILSEFNKTETDVSETLIHERFAAIAQQKPDHIAVESDGATFTYQELDERSERLAHFLRSQGVGPDVRVGICMERSVEMLVGLFGILKAGGAYVPIDPAHPQERLTFLLTDSAVSLLLTQERLLARFSQVNGQVVCLDRDASRIASTVDGPPPSRVGADNLAYMIYTSGSTGTPKGVLIPHRGLSNYLTWALDAYEVEKGIGSIVSTSLAFDATITSLFLPLLAGGRVILLREGEEVEQLSQELRKRRNVSLLKITPTHLQLLSQQLSPEELSGRVRTVVIGGEALLGEHIAFWKQAAPETRLINEYGPTETVVGCAVYEAVEATDRPVPIGRPIANMQLYVLDEFMQPVPIGVQGELYIGGIALADGYHNRPELTAERFVPHPFSNQPGDRLYKTGDMVRYLSDGNLEYMGRVDDQVKVRGYRIEPGEIEAVLLQHSRVAEATVILREDTPGDQRLVAYVTVSEGNEWNARDVQQHLAERLPSYMVPQTIMVLDAIPLTVNGKADRQQLPPPTQEQTEGEYVAPRTLTEKRLATIYQDVLNVEKISAEDHFFARGGHSLLAVQVISRIRNMWNIELPVRALFEAPSIAELAEQVDETVSESTEKVPLVPVERTEALPASFAQQRLWFLEQLEGTSALYHIPLPLYIEGRLNQKALTSAIQEIVQRHEILRTTFKEVDGDVVQDIAPAPSGWHIPLIDLSGEEGVELRSERVQRLIYQLAEETFDLAEGPLFRSHLVKLSDVEHLLVLNLHHIISDGWSNNILIQELTQLYEAFAEGQSSPLPKLAVQYADYAVWQRKWLQGGRLEKQLRYWKNQLANAPSLLSLPTDYQRPSIQSYRGAVRFFELSAALSDRLKKQSDHAGVTLFMTLITAYKVLLFRESGAEDLLVGFPVANRNHSKIEGLVGFFVNTLVLRSDLSGNPTFEELLNHVRKRALEAYANQDVPFEKLVEELQPERDRSYSPLCQVLFAFEQEPLKRVVCQDVTIHVCEIGLECSKFDLTFFMEERGDRLVGSVEYCTDLFTEETIERMIDQYKTLLESVVESPQQRLREIPLYSEEGAFNEQDDELFDE
ncbi:amino acid adenylation domain-containing protein [Melghirimyces algeriensis]|uniref:Amino acid adenylation domain-containing protein n=1 Tax=Melghirimyces algeriensis TaxID=910412 RepID=A0A521CW47_9BACL|nr:non-ribosomal peptide synthetase [Melghirimyces algeriensis]SMO63679.1 amino acid adenylation domain-containing protein [Melghirimyces algeriensis]